MNKVQIAKYNSFIKSDDFLDDNSATLASVSQIAPLAAALKTTISNISTAMGIAEQDNTGYTIDKNNKLNELKRLMLKVGRAATAYYQSINNIAKLSISDFNKSEIDQMTDSRVHAYAIKLHAETLPNAASLIGATAADLTALNAAIAALGQVLEDPRRAIDISKRHNDSIDGLLKDGDKQRETLDIYMRTFIDANPGLYAEWRLALAIDDLPTTSSPDFSTPISATGGGTPTTIDYTPLGGLDGSTDIVFTLPIGIAQGVRAGFGLDPASILPGKEIQLASGSSPRRTAASLGYDNGNAPYLNIINDTPNAVSVIVEFYKAG